MMNRAAYDEIRQLAEKTRTSAVGHAFLLFISVSAVRTPENTPVVIAFAGLILALSAGRVAMGKPRPDVAPGAVRRWYYAYATLTVASALTWGLFCAQSIATRGPGDRSSILLLIVTAGIAAAGSNSLSASRRLASLFTFATLAPVATAMAYQDLWAYLPVVALLATYQVFLVLQIGASNVMIRSLREREQQYRTLVDSTHETILVHREGVILEVNAAFQRTFGYVPAEVIGRSAFELAHPDEVDAIRGRAHQDDGGRAVIRARHRDGRYLTVEVRARNLIYQGQPARVACLNDITTQVAAEESLRQNIEQRRRLASEREAAALEALRLKSEFLANVGHEMRTPLNGIIGLSDLLEAAPEGDVRRGYLTRLRASGQSLLALINELLDFTELDAGRIEFADEAFALAPLIERPGVAFAEAARVKGLTLTTAIDANLPARVRGDANRLNQVLGHLINNALKFTTRGGVLVRAASVAQDHGSVRLRVEVEDTGLGVPHEMVHRLFNPFSQGDASTSRRFGGTGLGLSICKRVVDGLGGQIGFEALPSGSRFWFEVPLAIARDGAASGVSRPAPTQFKAARVLVVEDNSTNQLLILALLASLGLRARAVVNGVECLRAVGEDEYDVILMDCQMPEMDGYEATRRIRAREAGEGGHVPIVAVTANVMHEDRERCLAAGMDAFVPKPVKREVLAAELARFLEAAGGSDEKAS